jgi:hypothetical protein
LPQIISAFWELSKDIFLKKTLILGVSGGVLLGKLLLWAQKCPQRKILIAGMDPCPEGSIWQGPSLVERDTQASMPP